MYFSLIFASLPSHAASENVSLLLKARGWAFRSQQPQTCHLCQREFAINWSEEPGPQLNLSTDGSWLTDPSLHDMLSDAQGTV